MSNRLDQEREAKLQPVRIKTCKDKLESLGLVVRQPDDTRLEFVYNMELVRFWPYSGWHTGKSIKDGRGFKKLLRQIEN